MRRITLLAAAAALVVTGCNGETETFSSDPKEDLVAAITSNASANPDRPLDDEDAACIIQEIVDDFGVEGLAELGVTAENPDLQGGRVFATPDAARRVVDSGMACIDMAEAFNAFLPDEVTLLDDTVECVVDRLQSDTFRDLFAGLFVEGAEPADIMEMAAAQLPIGSLFVSCLSADEILRLGDILN
jgi:hypothetical protein